MAHDKRKKGPQPDHDHRRCVAGIETRAEAGFAARGMKLTPLRHKVLATIASSHDTIGAYEVVDRIAREGGARLAPVSVYRIIDSLIGVGVVHKLASRQAFYACHGDHADGRQIALVCQSCSHVDEVDGKDLLTQARGKAGRHGFKVGSVLLEIQGTCRRCAESAAPVVSNRAQRSASAR